ncbi:EAL domain-containing protein [Mesorhizobium sp. CAU 1732]|uniref:bifunctional diguanylate cyclase/phosphodiesterase n=1 Tax=Mesorhizobium sp. CAU 1732 TaxID=3140358 RepID=UPI003261BBB9
MLTVYNCIVNDHDIRLVVVAGILCAIASLTAVALLQHLRRATGTIRMAWLGIAAAAFGFGVWATHFVAMLAFAPGLPSAYDMQQTLLSLAIAIVITGAGLAVASSRETRDHHLVGGAILGAGIAAMHFVGMMAYEVEGHLVWDQRFVAAALVVGLGLGAVAMRIALSASGAVRNVTGALALTLGICGLHFIGMGAVTIQPDTSVVIPASSVTSGWLAASVAVAALTILLFAAVALWVDLRDMRRSQLEADRMNGLANAAVEGLVVCKDGIIVTVNASFLAMTGRTLDDIAGAAFVSVVDAKREHVDEDAAIIASGGARLPVEIISRNIDYGGSPHTIYAVRDLRERKKAEADIRHLAMHDTLTGLPNRRAFNEKLRQELAANEPDTLIAMFCLDLDRFKEVNDLFGHSAGDAMLQKVADCVIGVLRPGQMVARLGGDEFAIIASGLHSAAEASSIADSILTAFRYENREAPSEGLMSTSIGIALYPQDAPDAELLVSHADTALYRAKAEGRDTWRFFEKSMGYEVRSRRIMEHELRHAVARDEFSLVYQPQKRLDTGETIGFEALLRWNHPARGSVAPSVFIPVAEESGIIVSIGEWVLETACQQAVGWDDSLTVAVNVSAMQLHSPDFAQCVHRTLLRTGLSPHRLELEITETALVRDMNRALATLRQLKALGVRVAMDDFGTGYSSLSNLRAFPFDKIKIDGSFIRSVDTNEEAATIVKAVLGIGRGLGLPVLAEGVETSEELKFLSGEFCQIGQGYLLGRPAPIENFDLMTLEQIVAPKAASAA